MHELQGMHPSCSDFAHILDVLSCLENGYHCRNLSARRNNWSQKSEHTVLHSTTASGKDEQIVREELCEITRVHNNVRVVPNLAVPFP